MKIILIFPSLKYLLESVLKIQKKIIIDGKSVIILRNCENFLLVVNFSIFFCCKINEIKIIKPDDEYLQRGLIVVFEMEQIFCIPEHRKDIILIYNSCYCVMTDSVTKT